jgi:hypothetical protein
MSPIVILSKPRTQHSLRRWRDRNMRLRSTYESTESYWLREFVLRINMTVLMKEPELNDTHLYWVGTSVQTSAENRTCIFTKTAVRNVSQGLQCTRAGHYQGSRPVARDGELPKLAHAQLSQLNAAIALVQLLWIIRTFLGAFGKPQKGAY